jgi:hypothetical protein
MEVAIFSWDEFYPAELTDIIKEKLGVIVKLKVDSGRFVWQFGD